MPVLRAVPVLRASPRARLCKAGDGAMDGSKEGIAWLVATGAVLVGVFFLYPLSLGIPLIDPDEGLHAAIAQEMVESGDWVTPQFLKQPFFDKPILFTWSQALSLKLFGMNEAASRLPGMLFGIAATVITGILGWRMFGPMVGAAAVIIYSSSLLPLALTQVAVHDAAMIPWIALAVLLFWEADRAESSLARLAYTLGIGLSLGLTCLTKGLVGVALVGVAYGSYLLVSRRLSTGACLRGAAALAIAVLIALPWYAAMERRNPGYLHYYFVERHLLGYVTSTQKHGDKPFWFYLPILLWGSLPWIVYLPVGLRQWWLRRRDPAEATKAEADRAPMLLLLCWLIGGTLFLSAAHSKLITYIWPVFPPLAVLIAVVWARLIEGRLTPSAARWMDRSFCVSCLAGPAILPIGMIVAQSVLHMRFSGPQWVLGVLAGLTCWVPLIFWRAKRPAMAMCLGSLTLAVQFAVALAVIGPPASRVVSAGDLARYFNRCGRIPARVVLVEDRVGSLVFYLDPRLRAGLKEGRFQPIRAQRLPTLRVDEPDTLIVLADWRVRRAQRYVDLRGIPARQAGRYRLYTPAQLKTLQARAAVRPESRLR